MRTVEIPRDIVHVTTNRVCSGEVELPEVTEKELPVRGSYEESEGYDDRAGEETLNLPSAGEGWWATEPSAVYVFVFPAAERAACVLAATTASCFGFFCLGFFA